MLRPAGTRRDHYVVRTQRDEFLPWNLVVAHDHRLADVDLAQQVEEVECVGVVVVDQQRAQPSPHCRAHGAPVSTRRLRVAVLGSTGGWHARRLERALTARGHECGFAPVTRMVGRVEGGVGVRSGELTLDGCDVVLVRGIPRGSLEQVVFRVDVLHALAAGGVRAINSAHAIERTVYYLQETLPHAGRDVRALVVGDEVVASIERTGDGWRTNLARGARARPVRLDREQEDLCVPAAAALGADYAGVDLLRAPDGRDYVVEVNGIPGWHGVEHATGVDVAAALA